MYWVSVFPTWSVFTILFISFDAHTHTHAYDLKQESRLIEGVAFKKTFSYAGFEMQRKKFTGPKIVLLNVELELKAEKENAELRIENVEVMHVFK